MKEREKEDEIWRGGHKFKQEEVECRVWVCVRNKRARKEDVMRGYLEGSLYEAEAIMKTERERRYEKGAIRRELFWHDSQLCLSGEKGAEARAACESRIDMALRMTAAEGKRDEGDGKGIGNSQLPEPPI